MTRTYSFRIGAALTLLLATVFSSGACGDDDQDGPSDGGPSDGGPPDSGPPDGGSPDGAPTNPGSPSLLAQTNLTYLGGFRLPRGAVGGQSFSFGGRVAAFNPAGPSLFVSTYQGSVAEVSIPTPVDTADVTAMPFATLLQPYADPTEGHLSEVGSSGVNLSGLLVSGGSLYGTASIFYDASNTQALSHFSRSLQLSQPSFSGWSRVWDANRTGYVSGMMGLVPSEWQAKLGGSAVTGQCCIPIVSRTSTGPAAFAFEPSQIGQPTVSATPLVYYSLAHATLGDWAGSNPTYGATTQMGGVAIIAGSRTALFFGSNGTGTHCYGNGTGDMSLAGTIGPDGAHWCYDPTNSSKGSHAYPYNSQMWAYDLNDLAEVKAGNKLPWEVVPYGVWPLALPTPESTKRLGGVAYDAEHQIVYVTQIGADPDGFSSRAIIHALQITLPTSR